MKNALVICVTLVCLLIAGCKTTEPSAVVPVAWKDQQAFASRVKDPRYFGYSIYQTAAGVEYRGGCRLHPGQAKVLPMVACDPQRPVVMMSGRFGEESPLLLDFCAPISWMEFDLAQAVRAVPVSEQNAQLVKISGEEIPGCPSVIPTLKMGQIFIENPQVMVRMANGSLGSLARGILRPEPQGVIGWDVLNQFGQIHLDYAGKKMALITTKSEYQPNPAMLAAALPLVQHARVCTVHGEVDGKQTLVLIDPAGDFEVATDGGTPVEMLRLGEGFGISVPSVAVSPGGTRIGARLLQNFKITVCPQEGMIFFERPVPAEK